MISVGYVSENGKNTVKKQVDIIHVTFIRTSRKRIQTSKRQRIPFSKARMKCSDTSSITRGSIIMVNQDSWSKSK